MLELLIELQIVELSWSKTLSEPSFGCYWKKPDWHFHISILKYYSGEFCSPGGVVSCKIQQSINPNFRTSFAKMFAIKNLWTILRVSLGNANFFIFFALIFLQMQAICYNLLLKACRLINQRKINQRNSFKTVLL